MFREINILDALLYAWSGLFLIALSVGFPPLALAFLLYPEWHRRRLLRRRARREAAARQQKLRWIEGL